MNTLRFAKSVPALLFFGFIISVWGCAQTSSTVKGPSSGTLEKPYWQITLSGGEKLGYATLDSVSGSSLFVSSGSRQDTIPVAQINEMRKVRRSYAFEGFLAGAVIGGIIGHVTTPGDWQGAARVGGALLGAPVGLIFGLAAGTDEVYDLSGMPPAGKITAAIRITAQASKER